MTGAIAALAGIAVVAAFYLLVPVALVFFYDYSRGRAVTCPHSGREATVRLDAARAAATAMRGLPVLNIVACSAWQPVGSGCDRACAAALA
jgi:hypothetical protein